MVTILVAIFVLGLAAAVLSAPLVMQRLEPYALAAGRPDAGEADRLMEALSDLEQSHLAGKVSAGDYAAQRERLELAYVQLAERKPPRPA